jgi:hypothetical protein
METRSLLPDNSSVVFIDAASEDRLATLPVVATQDHTLIQKWAEKRHAEPATGEATRSGPSTVSVNDDGTGIRFNFPGLGRFRPIEWDEWFQHFDTHALVFVYERDDVRRTPSSRYRMLPLEVLKRMTDLR